MDRATRRERRLIVNADDLGMSAPVNAGIIAAHRHGIVTSATLLANGEAFAEAVALARSHPALGVGVHLDVVEGRPLSPPQHVPSLLGEDGRFIGGTPALAARSLRGRLVYRELVAELVAQIARVVDAGIRPTHVDTHQHAHCVPTVCAAVLDAATRFGIRRIRFPRERNLPGWSRHARSRVRSALTAWLASLGRDLLVWYAARTTDTFVGPQLMGAVDEAALVRLPWMLPRGTTELMCHPSIEHEPGALLHRHAELTALTSPCVRDAIAAAGVRLTTFASI